MDFLPKSPSKIMVVSTILYINYRRPRSIFTNHSFERSLSYSPNFHIFDAFECNTTSYWLNRMVEPIRSCVTFKFATLGEKDKEYSRERLVNRDPGVRF